MGRYFQFGRWSLVWCCLFWCHPQLCLAASPSYSCSKVKTGTVEALICSEESLAVLDRQLAGVYVQSIAQLGEERSMDLRIEQRGWIRSRDACSKDEATEDCVRRHYRQRIAELQATYRLVPMTGPVRFFCEGQAQATLYVTYHATDPVTIIVDYDNKSTLMYQEPSASGARYVRGNQSFWELEDTALVSWGFDMPESQCQTGKPPAAR
nr:MliC family protein [uncultured Desulfobulbus sp.]